MNPDPDEHAHPGQEDLHWGEGIKKTQRDKKPSSKYSALSEQARKIIPGESQCRMFCGGKACKYCTPETWKPEQMVVSGLYSEWVTDNILAMARMSTENIDKFKMVDQLKKMGVKSIINLQQPGEHAFCGNGVGASGFSYEPQRFMEAGLFFYNFAMGDYGVASMPKLLDIVKVTQFAVSQGKVTIHCHAGLGRTGLIIACYLIYNNRVKASKSVQYVRSRRAGAIQTKEQVKTCHEFEQYLKLFYVIFPSRIPDMHSISFNHFLNRQQNLLHGYEGKKLKHLPKIIYICCERLLELCGKGRSLSSLRQVQKDRLAEEISAMDSGDSVKTSSDSELYEDKLRTGAKLSKRTKHKWSGSEENIVSKSNLPEWKQRGHNLNAILRADETFNHLKKKKDSVLHKRHHVGNNLDEARTADGYDYESSDEEDNNPFYQGVTKPEGYEQTENSDNKRTFAILDVEDVCDAVMTMDYSAEELEAIRMMEEDLNKSDEAWSRLASQARPSIVCGVMWDWFDGLCEPILRAQDVYTLIENSSDLRSALIRLETSTKHFLEYIARVLSKLEPVPAPTLQAVIQRFLCHLTQKKHGNFDTPSSSSVVQMIEEKSDVSQSIFDLFMRMIMREKERK